MLEEFKVALTKVAQKDIDKLEPKTKLKVLQATKELKVSPFPKSNIIKRLKGVKIALYRLRVGDFRVVYHIDHKNVVILFVVDRKDLEKELKFR